MGMTQFQIAQAMNLGAYGRKAIYRWEKHGTAIPGPAQVAMRFMLRDAGLSLDMIHKGDLPERFR